MTAEWRLWLTTDDRQLAAMRPSWPRHGPLYYHRVVVQGSMAEVSQQQSLLAAAFLNSASRSLSSRHAHRRFAFSAHCCRQNNRFMSILWSPGENKGVKISSLSELNKRPGTSTPPLYWQYMYYFFATILYLSVYCCYYYHGSLCFRVASVFVAGDNLLAEYLRNHLGEFSRFTAAVRYSRGQRWAD